MGVDLFDVLGGQVNIGNIAIACPSSDTSVAAVDHTNTMSPVSLTARHCSRRQARCVGSFTDRQVQQRFWHPTQAMREPIERELLWIEQEGGLECIDSSPWTSNITSRKKDGGIRICVRQTDADKALIPEQFPLPTMQELTE
jgi:hypothetical protein